MNCLRFSWRVFFTLALVPVLLGGLTGCFPGDSTLDEEKDPHFLEGQSKVSSLDYAGAAEAFGRALQANPKSASAHKQLGLLYFEHLKEPDSAIYHFRKVLQLRPTDPHADVWKQDIESCRLDLARSISFGPLTAHAQEQLSKAVTENETLKKQIELLRQELQQVSAAAAQRQAAPANPAPAPVASPARTSPAVETPRVAPANVLTASAPLPDRLKGIVSAAESSKPTPSVTRRTNETTRVALTTRTVTPPPAKIHKVKAGESFATIAPRYGISTATLQSANPGIDSRRLKVGQELKLPAR